MRGREAELFQPVRVHVTPVQVAYPLFIRRECSGAHLQTADDGANLVFALDLQVLESTGTGAIRRDDGFVVPGAIRKAEEIIAWPDIAVDTREIDAPFPEYRLYTRLRYLVSRVYRCAGGPSRDNRCAECQRQRCNGFVFHVNCLPQPDVISPPNSQI